MIFAVLTTVVAFLPLAFVEGMMGKFMFNIPVVVIAILLFSLVESLLILPAHLATMKAVRTQQEIEDAASRRRLVRRASRTASTPSLSGFVERSYRQAPGLRPATTAPIVMAVAIGDPADHRGLRRPAATSSSPSCPRSTPTTWWPP